MLNKAGVIKYELSYPYLTDTEVQKHWPSHDTYKHNIERFRDMKDSMKIYIKSNALSVQETTYGNLDIWNLI